MPVVLLRSPMYIMRVRIRLSLVEKPNYLNMKIKITNFLVLLGLMLTGVLPSSAWTIYYRPQGHALTDASLYLYKTRRRIALGRAGTSKSKPATGFSLVPRWMTMSTAFLPMMPRRAEGLTPT